MSNKILLHEKLKIYAENGGPVLINGNPHVALYLNEALDVAEEIERRYIPKPCDPEGDPWEVGQQCDWGTITALCWKGGEWLAEINGDVLLHATESINRPVLDADGVPIRPGDSGYGTYGAYKARIVKAVYPAGTWRDNREPCVEYVDGGWDVAVDFAHRNHDSLKKLRDDIADFSTKGTYHGAIDSFLQKCQDRLDNFTGSDA